MARPRLHDEALHTRLLEVASELIARSGAEALTVRGVAKPAGTSTSAVYALFGSRDELVGAVGAEAFRRFAGHLARAPRTDDARADLLALGLAYRDSALEDPHFYRVMFDVSGTGGRAPDAGAPTARETFAVLRDAACRVLEEEGVPPATARVRAEDAAGTLWALVHGLVSLELAGLVPGTPDERAERYARALAAAGPGVLAAAAQV